MLWYLLSPIRGTTQPPRLSTAHPVRRAFYRHGKTTAQHWLIAMLVSVAIAAAFSYPTILLSERSSFGFAGYPHHVWTTAKPVSENISRADIELRQVWIHGDYMSCMNKSVLKRGLAIQQSIVADDELHNPIHAPNADLRPDELQWGLHSPLMYWNNSEQTIDADQDIEKTVNDQQGTLSSLNVALRPASVFAGKKFQRRRLVAADALIITLMARLGKNDLSGLWHGSMYALTHDVCANCTLYPQDGQVSTHRMYEFSFQPLSLQEHVVLTIAYSAMALYVLLSLRRMKAFHSRFGLVVTAITQMTCSILASFTICGVLKINLSMIPQNAYPFVVLVLGVENIFRLINAVLQYPPTMNTEIRIANALGDVGPLSVAAAAQNLTILSLLSTVVSPGVAAFCAFAAIATLFDSFFLMTFFVAVLNVDIRRLELQDALTARHSHARHRRRLSPSQHTWFDALLEGKLPFSTRMAGTAVTTAFILSLNYHFFEQRESTITLRDLLGFRRGPPSLSDLNTFAPPPINASLTTGEWMRTQDFDTAKEVMRLARPEGQSFIVRVYAPLIVVLAGSDRTGASRNGIPWTHALRSFALHHFYPVAVAVVFAVAFVAVLMNFLLYDEAGDEENDRNLEELDEILTADTVNLPHRLDVVMLKSNDCGQFVSVALDRTICISTPNISRQGYCTVTAPAEILNNICWPIQDLAIDNGGEWIACHGADGRVSAYNHNTGTFMPELVIYPDDNPSVVFSFKHLPSSNGTKLHLVVVTSGGRLVMSIVEDSSEHHTADISIIPLLGASILEISGQNAQLCIVTERANIVSFVWNVSSSQWKEAISQSLQIENVPGALSGHVNIDLYSDPDANLLVVMASSYVVFLHSSTLTFVAKIDLAEAGLSFDTVLVSPGRRCHSCDGPTLRKIAAASAASQGFDLATWSTGEEDDVGICLRQGSTSCRSFASAIKEKQEVTNSGAWSALSSEAILGLRRQTADNKYKINARSPNLRQRRGFRKRLQSQESLEQWEAYKISIDGHIDTLAMINESEASATNPYPLYVHSAGPTVPLDTQAVAVAFGNVVKVIRASRRGSMSRRPTGTALERQSSTSKKRLSVRRGRS